MIGVLRSEVVRMGGGGQCTRNYGVHLGVHKNITVAQWGIRYFELVSFKNPSSPSRQ